MSPIIRPETTADDAAIREVNRLAFGGDGEARLVDALRDGGYARISLVAEEEGRAVGHVLFGVLAIATLQGEIEALSWPRWQWSSRTSAGGSGTPRVASSTGVDPTA